MKLYTFLIFLLIISCKTNNKEITRSKTREFVDALEAFQIMADSTYLKPEIKKTLISDKDTVNQKLIFFVDTNRFEFTFKYLTIRSDVKTNQTPYNEMLDLKQKMGPVKFNYNMLESIQIGYLFNYEAPQYLENIPNHLTDKDLPSVIIIKDFNMDGRMDFGISDAPSGHNISQSIYLNLKDGFVYWNKISGFPIWELNPLNRTITSGFTSGREYIKIIYQVTNDTNCTEIIKETLRENSGKYRKKVYRYGKLKENYLIK